MSLCFSSKRSLLVPGPQKVKGKSVSCVLVDEYFRDFLTRREDRSMFTSLTLPLYSIPNNILPEFSINNHGLRSFEPDLEIESIWCSSQPFSKVRRGPFVSMYLAKISTPTEGLSLV